MRFKWCALPSSHLPYFPFLPFPPPLLSFPSPSLPSPLPSFLLPFPPSLPLHLQRLHETLAADPDNQRQRIGEFSRKVTILQVNEKALSRRYSLLLETEDTLRKVSSISSPPPPLPPYLLPSPSFPLPFSSLPSPFPPSSLFLFSPFLPSLIPMMNMCVYVPGK